MIHHRPAHTRGHADHGWLRSEHTFSFAGYYDPAYPGWGNLRVINEDRIAPGTGFGTHGHRDMEIISYVMAGALAHQDSLGNQARIVPGEVQRMSAGRGVLHSERNAAPGEVTHFLQIWIEPVRTGIDPGYAQAAFPEASRRGHLRPVVSPDGRDGSLPANANAILYAGLFDGDERATLALDPARKAYVHLVRGALRVNGWSLTAGDALALAGEAELTIDGGENAEVLVFDLAP